MEVSTTSNSYCDWRESVDKRLHQTYCITIEDAGFDEDYLVNHWRSKEAPFEFVSGTETNTTYRLHGKSG
jgi:hypothetical protein